MDISRIQSLVAAIPDFPQPGIMFRDITPVLDDAAAFHQVIDHLHARCLALAGGPPALVVGMESRGFLFGAPLALKLRVGFAPVRKPGKLPRRTLKVEYTKEYGKDSLEIHHDAIRPGTRVVIVDDLLATGGTARASGDLVAQAGGKVVGYMFVIELDALGGRRLLGEAPVDALLHY
ncbi:MAG: adenine phosphoribosyltransferase [Deltaproteobacteria bacterium]|nr:adenine phosphoribosyltransferase [Deltaproteobacteria bacterium]